MRLRYFVLVGFLLTTQMVFAQGGEQRREQTSPEKTSDEQRKRYIYEWTDDKGVTHATDELGKVPKQYRSTARKREEPPETKETGGKGQPMTTAPSGNGGGEQGKAGLMGAWQERMRSARQRLSDLEQRYRDLDQKRTELLGSWGGAASGRLAEREQAAQIEGEMKRLQKEIDDARDQVENVIPDEARKAGVPPGWLRE